MLEGKLAAAVHFRFFLGAMRWGPGALDQEIDQGAWHDPRPCKAPLAPTQALVLPRHGIKLHAGRVRF